MITPFGGLAYIIVVFVTTLLILANPRYKRMLSFKKHIAFLEVFFTPILQRLLPLLILFDALTNIVRLLLLYIQSLGGRLVIVEDFLPQIIVDQIAYTRLYSPRSILGKTTINLLYRLTLLSNKRLFSKCLCVHVRPRNIEVHLSRAFSRGESVQNIYGFYNEVLRDKLVKEVCISTACRVVEVD